MSERQNNNFEGFFPELPDATSAPLSSATVVSSEAINQWISDTLANRLIITEIPDTVLKLGRVRGIRSIAITDATESQVMERMRAELLIFADRQIASGLPLPRDKKPPAEVSPDVCRCLVHSRVKALLRERASQWLAQRQKLPPHIMTGLLADFDQLLSRHASQIESA